MRSEARLILGGSAPRLIAFAQMAEVEIDDISRIAEQLRHYTYIGPVEMKSLQIRRHGEVGVAPNDEEVFIEAAYSADSSGRRNTIFVG